eukprot:CAMPEP_0172180326 /NCGR_PEP_ID=MMETSP1050-20130122/17159_1 /TAXON_ID=233186 /ORGANISM="Cryptomonas curvata, Strain CCAP979/52" /LENGTH=362 /DNA_ID=CAMNT_0012853403 /DNA_START=268 /DNA_END=1353 /DNA_ORIENTATION=+
MDKYVIGLQLPSRRPPHEDPAPSPAAYLPPSAHRVQWDQRGTNRHRIARKYARINGNAVPVDIITILPTLMTFVITMIGDTYPLPDSQTEFLGALQAFNFLRVVRLMKIQRLLLRRTSLQALIAFNGTSAARTGTGLPGKRQDKRQRGSLLRRSESGRFGGQSLDQWTAEFAARNGDRAGLHLTDECSATVFARHSTRCSFWTYWQPRWLWRADGAACLRKGHRGTGIWHGAFKPSLRHWLAEELPRWRRDAGGVGGPKVERQAFGMLLAFLVVLFARGSGSSEEDISESVLSGERQRPMELCLESNPCGGVASQAVRRIPSILGPLIRVKDCPDSDPAVLGGEAGVQASVSRMGGPWRVGG